MFRYRFVFHRGVSLTSHFGRWSNSGCKSKACKKMIRRFVDEKGVEESAQEALAHFSLYLG